MAHQLGLGDLGQRGGSRAAQARGQQLVERPLGHVERGARERAPPRARRVSKIVRAALALERRRAGARSAAGLTAAASAGALARPPPEHVGEAVDVARASAAR